jgi:DNA-binding NtrC family response regulator
VPGRVLIVDDDRDLCDVIAEGLANRDVESVTACDRDAAIDAVRAGPFDAVALDVKLGAASGLELCGWLADNHPDAPVVILTGLRDVDTAVEAIRAGAYDFITKPFDLDALELSLRRAMELSALKRQVRMLRDHRGDEVAIDGTSTSRPMRRAYELITQVAATEATVLITGESGTGKELAARAIHDRSPRSAGPFVAINCAAVAPSLLESELFGHVKGAFTDARTSRAGLFVQASGGTLFLDEIGEMAPEMQAKLLRVLQESCVRPVGGDGDVPYDARIVAATNRDLETDVEDGRFREDLYYRINVVRIELPPLRSRGPDVLELAQRFVEEQARRNRKDVRGITPAAAQKLLAYDWPGNVRELQNSIERAVALTRFDELVPGDLPEKVRDHRSSRIVIDGDDLDEMPTLEEVERRYIRRVLEAAQGNKSSAARVLGVDRRTLYRKLERLDPAGLDPAD